jgi:ADP-ribose pyrophosphatase
VTAENFEQIAAFYVSPGFLTEKMFVFLATGLKETRQSLDDDEIVEIVRLSFERAFEMIRSGEIEDAKTILGLTFAHARLRF